ncbi:MAG: rhodanese-like domain-containing protein [Thiotrichaceae bacterium]
MQHFNATELQEYLTQARPILLDVREPWEFKVCHIDGSQLIPMREIPSKISALDPQQEIVVICHHGIRSRQVCYFLENNGFTRVINLTGGVAAWARDVDPQMTVY